MGSSRLQRRQSSHFSINVNHIGLIFDPGIGGACAGLAAGCNRERVKMAFDPDELVTLTDHGIMKLRSAVKRAMVLLPKDRLRATIVRGGRRRPLKFEQIKGLAERWDEQPVRNEQE